MLYPQANAHRDILSLDGIYRFMPDRDGRAQAENWAASLPQQPLELAVPGSWNEQMRQLHDFHGEGWYERDFWVPASWAGRRIFLRVGSTAGNARLWLDGKLVGGHTGPHLPFEFDVTALVRPGHSHRLTIAVDNTLRWISLPPGQARREEDRAGFGLSRPDVPFDFFPYGGIHRSVVLYATDSQCVRHIETVTDYTGTEGVVRFTCEVEQSAAAETAAAGELRLEVSIGGSRVSVPVSGGVAGGEITVAGVVLWSPANPHLYETTFTLLGASGKVLDSYSLQLGVRKVQVEGNRLLLNGEPVFLKGFGKHEDFPILGKAWAAPVAVRDYDLMRWIGANSLRTSHYPYAEEMLSMADRLGFLVISETPFVSLSERVYTDEMRAQACVVIRELIRRDTNHPSVIIWSLANEPYIESDAGELFFKEMAQCARSCDTTRPVMYVAHEWPKHNRGAQYYDLLGVNKYYGWYHETGDIDGSLGKLEENLLAFHREFNCPILLGEFGADAVAGIHSDPPVLFSEEYQAETIEKQYRHVQKLPWIIGAHVWNFADFKTAQSITRVAGNKKGVFTRDRQPKLAAHVLKRLWAED